MLREDIQRLKNNIEGRSVFILGGGSSVTPLILEKLNSSKIKTFCVNSSVKYIDNPVGVIWIDQSWATTNLDYLNTLQCPKFMVRPDATHYITKNKKGIGNSTVLSKVGESGFTPNIDCVIGNNSGAYAINFLVNCKVKEIGLIGFDMKVKDNSTAHFHKEYTYAIRPYVYNHFKESIDSMAKMIVNYPVKIYNCNKDSALTCFPYKHMDEIL